MPRKLYEIAHDIQKDWRNVSPHAKPYLDAMTSLSNIREMYFDDTAKSIVLYFLSNAATWRGAVAREIKKELKAIYKG